MIFHTDTLYDANFLTFTNSKGLSLTLCNVGASLYACKFNGRIMNMTPESKKAFIADKSHYYGQIIGPLAVRYRKGEYKAGNKTYRFTPNEKGNALHSSKNNYGFLPFTSNVKIESEYTKVVFTATSVMDKKEGEDVDIEITYTIYEYEDRFDLDFKLTPHADYVLNPTTHIYWNLGQIDVKPLILKMPSSYHLSYDKELLPKKRRVKVDEVYDFRQGKAVGANIKDEKLQAHKTHGYDHFFFLDEDKITLESPTVRLTVITTGEGLQFYTGNYPGENNKLYCMDGLCEMENSGLTFECMDDPRLYGQPVTLKGTAYTQHNEYRLEKLK